MTKELKYSLIMTLYKNDKLSYFKDSIESIFDQTIPPSEIVIIQDGPVSEDVDSFCTKLKKSKKIPFNIVRLEENKGHGFACNVAVKNACNELIGKMDADDIAVKDRFEKQLGLFKEDKELTICSGSIAEFENEITNIISYRKVPLKYEDIKKFLRKRSPFNHPAVMYKKSAVISVGGYPEIRRAEDYYLWVKLLAEGYKAANLEKTLVYFRASEDSFARKKSYSNVVDGVKSRWFAYRKGVTSLTDFLIASSGFLLVFIIPKSLVKLFYNKVLR